MTTSNELALRGLWLAIIVLAATITAAAAAVALRATGARPQSMLTGGAATFVAAVGLGIGAWQFLDG